MPSLSRTAPRHDAAVILRLLLPRAPPCPASPAPPAGPTSSQLGHTCRSSWMYASHRAHTTARQRGHWYLGSLALWMACIPIRVR